MSKYKIKVQIEGGMLPQSINLSVFCSVENHVKKIIRLTIKVFYIHSNCCLYLKSQWSWSKPWKGTSSVISTSTIASVENTSNMFDSDQSRKLVQRGFNFTTGVGYWHNQNLGFWCIKPHDTKHPESGITQVSMPICFKLHFQYGRRWPSWILMFRLAEIQKWCHKQASHATFSRKSDITRVSMSIYF